MLRHNLLLIYRNFKRYKGSFFINLIGLSSGLACVLLIYLWVSDELAFDKFHENDDQLYQVMTNFHMADGINTETATPDLLAETLAEEMPEIQYAAEVTPSEWFGNFTLTVANDQFKGVGQFVGEDYFNMFSFDLLQGDKNQVLAEKNGIAISESLALRLFNTTDNVIGRTVEWELQTWKEQHAVTGVFKDVPENSTQQFEFVLPFEAFIDLAGKSGRNINWGNFGPSAYLVLKEGTNLENFNDKIQGFVKEKDEYSNVTLFLKAYSENYLHGQYENGLPAGGRILYVKLFSLIALFILVIACINFMNLSTAKASRRVKEVGVKKAVGASRNTLIFQYLGESVLMTTVSLLLAMLLVALFLPQFNEITAKQLSLNIEKDMVLSLVAISLLTGLVAGSYPALYLSGFNPAKVLKGKFASSTGELWARKGLVVLQFTLSAILIVSVLVVYKQIAFVQTQNLGYDQDNIIYFKKEGKVAENPETFLAEMRSLPGIINVSSIQEAMVGSNSSTEGVDWPGKNPDADIQVESISADYDLLETLGVELTAGRAFSRDYGADSARIIFNEAAIKIMGLTDPIGKMINLWGDDREIIGVVKNFHFESFHESIKPLFFILQPERTMTVMAKIEAGREQETISRLEAFYRNFNPGYEFQFNFLDQTFRAQYAAEQRVALLSRYFAGLAILISCLGLFGLVAFTAERRVKEIGIRKVLGASATSIVRLLSASFTKMVITAIVIALPLSYFIAKSWLDGFAYRIELEWWFFAGAGLAALLIAWLTVSLQTIKAARINPVDSLKGE